MTPERWRQIEELYHEALRRPGEAPARFLTDGCPDDAALRRDVEELLAAPTASGFLSTPAFVAMADSRRRDV